MSNVVVVPVKPNKLAPTMHAPGPSVTQIVGAVYAPFSGGRFELD